MAVVPIARPARKRRTSVFMTLVRTGDAGCSRSAEKAQAEIMNVPIQRASIMYSGQCSLNACFALSVQCPVLAWAATGSSSSCAANSLTAVAGVHWNSLLMCRGIRHSEKGYTCHRIPVSEPFEGAAPYVPCSTGCNLCSVGESHTPDGSPPSVRFLACVPPSPGVLLRHAKAESEKVNDV